MAMHQLVDIHAHILAGLDDGPKAISESIAMARCYAQCGITRVIATPHYIHGTAWAPSKEKVLDSVTALQKRLKSSNISLHIEAGMEIAYHKQLAEHIAANLFLPLGQSGYYLIEPSFHDGQEGLLACLDSLLSQGKKIVLAHPERAEGAPLGPEQLAFLVEKGLLVQANAASLLGIFGDKCRTRALQLWRGGCLHLIASDAHDHIKRPPLTSEQWKNITALPEGRKLVDCCIGSINKIFNVD